MIDVRSDPIWQIAIGICHCFATFFTWNDEALRDARQTDPSSPCRFWAPWKSPLKKTTEPRRISPKKRCQAHGESKRTIAAPSPSPRKLSTGSDVLAISRLSRWSNQFHRPINQSIHQSISESINQSASRSVRSRSSRTFKRNSRKTIVQFIEWVLSFPSANAIAVVLHERRREQWQWNFFFSRTSAREREKPADAIESSVALSHERTRETNTFGIPIALRGENERKHSMRLSIFSIQTHPLIATHSNPS